MIKNEEIKELVNSKMVEIEHHLNEVELELVRGEDANISKVSLHHGKMSKLFADVAYYMGIFEGEPKF